MGHVYLSSSSTGILAVKELMENRSVHKGAWKGLEPFYMELISSWSNFEGWEPGSTDVVVLRLGMILTTGSLSHSAVVFWGQYWWCQVLWAALWPGHGSGPEAEWGCGLCPGEDEYPGHHQQHAAVMVARLCGAGPPRMVLTVLTVLTFLPKRNRYFWASCTYHLHWTERLLFY